MLISVNLFGNTVLGNLWFDIYALRCEHVYVHNRARGQKSTLLLTSLSYINVLKLLNHVCRYTRTQLKGRRKQTLQCVFKKAFNVIGTHIQPILKTWESFPVSKQYIVCPAMSPHIVCKAVGLHHLITIAIFYIHDMHDYP